MASLKYSTSLFFLIATVAVIAVDPMSLSEDNNFVESDSHHLIIGKKQPNDDLVYQETIGISASLIGKKVTLEKTFNAILNHVITQVRAIDIKSDGTGAYAMATAGGPGHQSVTLRFESQRFHGIYFIVQLFAKQRI